MVGIMDFLWGFGWAMDWALIAIIYATISFGSGYTGCFVSVVHVALEGIAS